MWKIIVTAMLMFLFAALSGCATNLKVPSLEKMRQGQSDTGIVMLSAGRRDKSNILFGSQYPFINYRVYKLDKFTLTYEPTNKIIEGQPSLLSITNPSGQVGSGRFVFVHMFELNEGKYALRAMREVGNHPMEYDIFTGYPDHPSIQTENYFVFSVDKNKVNYAGELLTVCDDIYSAECFQVNDEFFRDYKFVVQQKKEIKVLEVRTILAEKVQPNIKGD